MDVQCLVGETATTCVLSKNIVGLNASRPGAKILAQGSKLTIQPDASCKAVLEFEKRRRGRPRGGTIAHSCERRGKLDREQHADWLHALIVPLHHLLARLKDLSERRQKYPCLEHSGTHHTTMSV